MIQNSNIVVAIDVGTSKVCAILARTKNGRQPSIIAHSVIPSNGLHKGNVTDLQATQAVINESVSTLAKKTGEDITEAYVGITGTHIGFQNRIDTLTWAAERGVITPEDIRRVPGAIADACAESGRKVLHALTRNYTLDGQRGIRNPLGMHTNQLKVETHVITASSSSVEKLTNAVEKSGISIRALVLEPMASAWAVLTEDEKETGVALIDIGAGTTDIIIYKQGTALYSTALPVGGFQFTNDIHQYYDTTFDAAEAAKLKYGTTDPTSIKPTADISLPLAGRVNCHTVALRELSQLLRERAQELVRLIRIKLRDAGYTETTAVRIVLTGGSANLPGLEDMIRRTLTRHVRIGVPQSTYEIPEELRSPMFATSVGILSWAIEQNRSRYEEELYASNIRAENTNGRISRFFRKMFSN